MNSVTIEAAEWFERLQSGKLSVEEVAEWQQWLASDPACRESFEQLDDLWLRLDEVTPPALPSAKRMRADRYSGNVPIAEWNAASRTAKWRHAAAAVVLVALAAAVIWRTGPAPESSVATVFETQTAEHREVRLDDGSVLSIGGKSAAWVRFSPATREVVLDRGEAFFKVAKDARRPFTVRAGEATIVAVGTAFNVRKTGDRVQVAVAEGAVNVSSKDEKQTRLNAGHQVTIASAAATARVSAASPRSVTAWRSGRLQYLGEPLKYVVADVNRYSKHEISVEDAAVGELLVTGTVFEDDVEGWLETLEKILPLSVERSANGRVKLEPRR